MKISRSVISITSFALILGIFSPLASSNAAQVQQLAPTSYVRTIGGKQYIVAGRDFFSDPANLNFKITTKLGTCLTTINGCFDTTTHKLNQVLINKSLLESQIAKNLNNVPSDGVFRANQSSWVNVTLGVLGAAVAIATIVIVVASIPAAAAYISPAVLAFASQVRNVASGVGGGITACKYLFNSCR